MSSFLNKLTTLVSVIGLEMLLLLTSIVIYFAAPTSNVYLSKNDIEVKPTGLIYKTNNGLECHNHGYAYVSKKPVNSSTKFQGTPLKDYGVSPSDFLNFAWTNGKKKAHSNAINAINLESQFASMYRYYDNKALSSMDLSSKLNNISRKYSRFADWDLKFSKNNDEIINNPSLVKFDNFVLGLNNGAEIDCALNYLKDINNISYTDHGTLNPDLWNDEVKLPIYKINKTTKQWVVQEFNNIAAFANCYYSNEMINYSQEFTNSLIKNSYDKKYVTPFSFYSSIVMSYVYKELGVETLNNCELGTKLVEEYSKLIFKFQYWTYLTLEQIFLNDVQDQIDSSTLSSMFSVLNLDISQPDDYNITTYAMVDNPSKIDSDNKVVLKVNNPLSIIPKQNLDSIAYVQTSIEYNYVSLYLIWFFVGLVLGFTGLAILSKKDTK